MIPLHFRSVPCVVVLGSFICAGQNAPPLDPSPATQELPVYLRVLPKPAPEPWSRITREQRLRQYVQTTYSLYAALGALSGAAISQGIDSPTEWGQGWDAYGIRVASSYGSTLVGNSIVYATSALFHEDNRYFRSRSQDLFGRLGHVIVSPYVARNDEGRTRFSASMFIGSAGYTAVPLAWSPSSWQGWDSVGINYLLWYGEAAGLNLAKELYPSLIRHFRNKHAKPAKKSDGKSNSTTVSAYSNTATVRVYK